MTIDFNCPHCAAQINAPEFAAGQFGACNECGQRIQVPAGAGERPSQTPPVAPSAAPPTPVVAGTSSSPEGPSPPPPVAPPSPAPSPPLEWEAQPRRGGGWALAIGGVLLLVVAVVGVVVAVQLTGNDAASADGSPRENAGEQLRFDAGDLQATRRWADALTAVIRQRGAEVDDGSENQLRLQRRRRQHALELEEVDKRLSLLEGAKIQWRFPIESVDTQFVHFENFYGRREEVRNDLGLLIRTIIEPTFIFSFDPGATDALPISQYWEYDEAAELDPGETVLVAATVESISISKRYGRRNVPPYVHVQLTNVSLPK